MKRRPAFRQPSNFPAENVFARWTGEQLRAYPEVERCHFVDCDFSGADLTNKRFTDCLFERCNLALATVAGAGLQNVAFRECKLAGVQFGACRDFLFEVHFEQCQLTYASFYGRRMPGTRFTACSLTDADFTSADLTDAVFQACTLAGTIFHQTQLNGADFRTATGFTIDPELNPLRKARFALEGLPGLVSKYELRIE